MLWIIFIQIIKIKNYLYLLMTGKVLKTLDSNLQILEIGIPFHRYEDGKYLTSYWIQNCSSHPFASTCWATFPRFITLILMPGHSITLDSLDLTFHNLVWAGLHYWDLTLTWPMIKTLIMTVPYYLELTAEQQQLVRTYSNICTKYTINSEGSSSLT